MTEHEAQGGDHGHGGHGHSNHGGTGKYVAVFVALCVFTAISFVIANSPIMDNPAIGWFGMMAVSCCKALLVVLFFMHLKWEANWKYVLTVPASIMSVFLIIMLVPDIGLRTRHYSEERWKNAAVPHASDSAQGHDHSDQQGSGGHSSGGGGGH